MATKNHNLSEYDPESLPAVEILSSQRYGLVVADWNSEITYALLEGAYDTLAGQGVQPDNITVVHVPGTFELTYAAKQLQEKGCYAAIIVMGCVIQGDTPHFDYVCQGVTQGITMLNARKGDDKTACPVIFSVLTTLNKEQALERAGGKLGNKGIEGAITAIKMANLFRQ